MPSQSFPRESGYGSSASFPTEVGNYDVSEGRLTPSIHPRFSVITPRDGNDLYRSGQDGGKASLYPNVVAFCLYRPYRERWKAAARMLARGNVATPRFESRLGHSNNGSLEWILKTLRQFDRIKSLLSGEYNCWPRWEVNFLAGRTRIECPRWPSILSCLDSSQVLHTVCFSPGPCSKRRSRRV